MRLLGLRSKPQSITFAVVDSAANSIVNIEEIMIPNALPIPESLKFVRNCILDIIREYQISKAGIRTTENNSQNMSITRIQIEGVIQESFASSDLVGYYTGQSSAISSRCGFRSSHFTKYVDGTMNYDPVENWSSLTKEQREAVLSAIGAENV